MSGTAAEVDHTVQNLGKTKPSEDAPITFKAGWLQRNGRNRTQMESIKGQLGVPLTVYPWYL